jgi:broad specificity phosphatase PhoE
VTGRIELVFETHSLTVDNEDDVATGWRGGKLSSSGRRFASALGERRRNDAIEVVFSSDLARAVETAETAFGATSIPVRLDWRLREIDYGELNGAPVGVVERQRAIRVAEPFPGGESYREAVGRVASFLDELRADPPGRRVLLIGHSATRFALDHLLDGRPLEPLVAAPFDWREGWEYVLEPRQLAAGVWR